MPDQNSIPAPPPGFVPASTAPSPSSSSSVPPPPAGFMSADSSSGSQTPDPQLAQQRAANDARPWWRKALGLGPATTPEDQAKDDAFWKEQTQRMTTALSDNYKARADVPVGVAKAAGRSAVGAANLGIKAYDKVTGNDKNLSSLITGTSGHEIAMPKALKSDGSFGQEAGGMFEGVEFIGGDELLKTLSVAEKFKLGAKIATPAEEHPAVAKLIHMGLNATRTGVVSGAQEAVHGGDLGDVATSAGTGALTSFASEGLGAVAKLAKPGTKQIAGEALQTAPKWKGAGTAAKLAEANQGASQDVISNVAHDSADAITKKFGKDAPDTIKSFRDAAQAVESSAKPIFQKLDEISNGGFQTAKNELDAANKISSRATSMKDLQDAEKAATTAQAKIDQIFTDSAGKVAPEDLQNARSAWRSKKVLEQLHTSIDKAYLVPQSAAEISGANRTLDLSKLQGRLNAAFGKIPQQDLQNVLGKEGTKNLFDLAQLGADPARAKTLGEIAAQIGQHLSAGGAGVIAGAALGHAIPGGSVALGAHFLFTHPEAGQLVVKALSKATNPKLVMPAVISSLIHSTRTRIKELDNAHTDKTIYRAW
jgi:hypothetical protein